MRNMSNEIQLDGERVVSFREVAPEDDAFLFTVYASTRQDELAMVEWTEAQRRAFAEMQYFAQKAHYQSHYPNAEYELILLNGEPVGRLWVARLDDEIRILDITLLPERRNGGIGTRIIGQLMEEGSKSGKPVHIYVEQYNPSLRLFERLRFSKVGEHGYSYKMGWNTHA